MDIWYITFNIFIKENKKNQQWHLISVSPYTKFHTNIYLHHTVLKIKVYHLTQLPSCSEWNCKADFINTKVNYFKNFIIGSHS